MQPSVKKILIGMVKSESCVAPPADSVIPSELILQFKNKKLSLFERYQAMTSLMLMAKAGFLEREEVIAVLSETARHRTKHSELIRHEAVFVIGQLVVPEKYITILAEVLRDDPSPVVRHEVIEALGNAWQAGPEVANKALQVVLQYLDDSEIIVAQSCELARCNLLYYLEPSPD